MKLLINRCSALLLTLVVLNSFSQDYSRETDSLALKAIHEANPESSISWDDNFPMNWWEGVSFNDEGRVDTLTFFSAQDLQALPSEIGNLTALEYLWVVNSELTELPAEIGNLTALKTLFLGSNKIEQLPAEIGALNSLEELGLMDNGLSSLPEEIGNLSNLKYVYLNRNKLTTLPETVGELNSLFMIDLSYNNINTLPKSFGNLQAIRRLNLEYNALESLPKSIISLTPSELLTFKGCPLNKKKLKRNQVQWIKRYDKFWDSSKK